jgi:hypothetical protein
MLQIQFEQVAPTLLALSIASPQTQSMANRPDMATCVQGPQSDAFFCYQGERNLTGWPHTILLGKPNSREPEVLPHQQNTPHAL